jgi:hypothetical protein
MIENKTGLWYRAGIVPPRDAVLGLLVRLVAAPPKSTGKRPGVAPSQQAVGQITVTRLHID